MWLPNLYTPGKGRALWRAILVRGFSGLIPLYVVNEYPRSGGSWVTQLLSAALTVPIFPSRTAETAKFRSYVVHGHRLRPFGLRNVVAVWRDGRDVMVSYYFFHYFRAAGAKENLVEKRLRFLDREDVTRNLPRLIERTFTRPIEPRFSWSEFVRVWYRREHVVHVRYEDMRARPVAELRSVVQKLTGTCLDEGVAENIIERFSFEKQANRKPGVENRRAYFRKGIVGDWKNYFNLEARQIFNHYAGDELIQLGYEPNHAWVGRGSDGS